jgi:adenosine 3'-phospho 5'-phosphosulfate transporter B2
MDLEDNRTTPTNNSNHQVEKYNKKEDSTSRNLKLLFCFVGLQISYLLWGLVQENIMTREYKMGKFTSSAFCVFGNRFLALFISLAIVLVKRLTSTKVVKEAPFYYYAPSSLSNSISSWAQYEALKYVSFPTQVLSKSCKIIPVMLVTFNYLYEFDYIYKNLT